MEMIRSDKRITKSQNGKPVQVTRAGEVAIAYECKQSRAQILLMHDNICCEELSV